MVFAFSPSSFKLYGEMGVMVWVIKIHVGNISTYERKGRMALAIYGNDSVQVGDLKGCVKVDGEG